MYHISDRPTTADLRISSGAPTQAYTPELIPILGSLSLRFVCLRSPSRQWLQNGNVVVDGIPSYMLSPAGAGGIYQCVGVVPGQPETDYTGEVGSDFYLLVPGM